MKDAFAATCNKRGTDHLQEQAEEIIKIIEADEQLQVLWRAYQKKYSYSIFRKTNEMKSDLAWKREWEAKVREKARQEQARQEQRERQPKRKKRSYDMSL